MSGSTTNNDKDEQLETKIDIRSIRPLEEIMPEEIITPEGLTIPEQNLNDEIEKMAELTDEEKRQKFIEAIKNSHKRYKPKKEFGVAYKKTRQRKNKQAKASRRLNRKK